MNNLQSLVNQDLTNFKITEMTQVYRVDEDGLNPQPIGYFKDPIVAEAFAGPQDSRNQTKLGKVLILTDGTVGYLMEDQQPVKFFNDEEEAAKLRSAALKKLSSADKKLLGLAED